MEDNSESQVTCTSSQLAAPAHKLLSFNIRRIRWKVEQPRRRISLAERLNSKLYEKYCSSQNFYYTKEIDNILCGIKSVGSIQYQEDLGFMTELERREEMLKRYYSRGEYPKKIKLLSEYYKFHEDVPRLAMLPLSSLIHNYHDQKRRINYIKITKMLNNGKIDSEIVRNMDPNEDSELSHCTVASSLLSFLPDEFKQTHFASSAHKPPVDRTRNLLLRNQPVRTQHGKRRSRERTGQSRLAPSHKQKDRPKAHTLSPISGRKGQFYLERPGKKHRGRPAGNGDSNRNSMSTVKNLNSILSEIFCNTQLTQRSFRESQANHSESSKSFWSAEESAIFSQSQFQEQQKAVKKQKLVRDSINKKILLKKFRPVNFISGFQSQLDEAKKVGVTRASWRRSTRSRRSTRKSFATRRVRPRASRRASASKTSRVECRGLDRTGRTRPASTRPTSPSRLGTSTRSSANRGSSPRARSSRECTRSGSRRRFRCGRSRL